MSGAFSPHFSHMFDGETCNSRNGAGLRAKDALWCKNRVYDTGEAILVPGKDAQVRHRRRISRYVEEPSAEDAAWGGATGTLTRVATPPPAGR